MIKDNGLFYISKENKSKYTTILSVIPIGCENAKITRELAKECHFNERTFRKEVENARNDGVIIASNNNGMFIPTTREELESWVKKTTRQYANGFRAMNNARKLLKGGK